MHSKALIQLLGIFFAAHSSPILQSASIRVHLHYLSVNALLNSLRHRHIVRNEKLNCDFAVARMRRPPKTVVLIRFDSRVDGSRAPFFETGNLHRSPQRSSATHSPPAKKNTHTKCRNNTNENTWEFVVRFRLNYRMDSSASSRTDGMVLMLNGPWYHYRYGILWHRDAAVVAAGPPTSFACSLARVADCAAERKTSTFCRPMRGTMTFSVATANL